MRQGAAVITVQHLNAADFRQLMHLALIEVIAVRLDVLNGGVMTFTHEEFVDAVQRQGATWAAIKQRFQGQPRLIVDQIITIFLIDHSINERLINSDVKHSAAAVQSYSVELHGGEDQAGTDNQEPKHGQFVLRDENIADALHVCLFLP